MARVSTAGAIIMCPRIFVATTPQFQNSSLQLDPGVVPHFLRREFIFGFEIQLVGARSVAQFPLEISQASQIVPGSLFVDERFISLSGVVVPALLKTEVTEQRSALRAVSEIPARLEIESHSRKPMKLEINIGLKKIKIAGWTEMLNGRVEGRLGIFELAKVSRERGALINQIDELCRSFAVHRTRQWVRDVGDSFVDPVQLDFKVS